MGTAYTPGLKVSAFTTVRKTRRLPLKGEVVVAAGQEVEPDTVVARTNVPGILRTVRAADILGVDADEVPAALLVKLGDEVEAGQLIASTRSFFGLFKSECRSPVAGVAELVSETTGHVGIRERPNPIEVTAYVRGRVAQVLEGEGVIVATQGAFIQGIFGVGGERRGTIRMAVSDPNQPITEMDIRSEHAGVVLCGGCCVRGAALRRAAEVGVAGIVVGAVVDQDLVDFLGYDIGVAITGHEGIPLTLIITEGFGAIRMAQRTFDLLRALEGQQASINGATQIRAGVIRPEVIVPRVDGEPEQDGERHDLESGVPIRIIREPYFGRLATVAALPSEPQPIPTGASVRVLEAQLASGERVTVPRANVELIEE
ncbi:MAG: hypothetical protein HY320_02105 [Armatimonadetes bacterium]|nr:hypothetical protein [Armatimonadota bacterium]